MKNYPKIILVIILVIATFSLTLCICRGFISPPPRVPVPAALVGPERIMRVSAYCPGSCCCGKWADGYTSSGVLAEGLIVAAPSDTKFGTVLDIPGYGRATVQDRGGAITGNRLDVLFATHQEALNWGVQYVMVREVK